MKKFSIFFLFLVVLIQINYLELCQIDVVVCDCKIKRSFHIINCNQLDKNSIKFPDLSTLKNLTDSGSELRLTNKNYSILPSFTFNGLILNMLDLSQNEIQFIDFNAFEGIYDLEYLVLSQNKLQTIELKSKSLENLKELNLRDNEIQNVGNLMFENLYYLVELDLSDNWIDEIDINVFFNLTKLKKLVLNLNELKLIRKRVFKHLINLQDLDLSKNVLEELNSEMFYGLENLKNLRLNENFIKIIGQDSFLNLKNLNGEINLEFQRIEEIEFATFKGLKKIVKIYLAKNQFKLLRNNSFRELDSLIYLDLSVNQISTLEYDTFKGLDKLVDLHLSFNKIYELMSGILANLKSLESLNLISNRLIKLDTKCFPESLKSLNLTLNKLQAIRVDYFHNLKNLFELYLDKNEISVIEPGSFDDLSNLNKLILSGNCLSQLDKNLFKFLINLKQLLLDGNLLTYLQVGVFENLENLDELDLSSNRISFLDEYSFIKLGKLRILNLANNLLRDFSDLNLNGLHGLDQLQLSNNFLKSFKTSHKRHFRILNLDNNLIEKIVLSDDSLINIFDLNQNTRLKSISFVKILSSINLRNTSSDLIESIPIELLNQIHYLDLSFNFIPENFVRKLDMKALRDLYLSATSFNYSIGILTDCLSLKILDLSNNNPKFDTLFMKKSLELRDIGLRATNISDLDKSMFDFGLFRDLSSLDLSSNQIRIIKSDHFGRNSKLIFLYLMNNLIFSMEQASLTSAFFTTLDLSNNQLTSLSKIFHNEKKLKLNVFNISNNFIKETNYVFIKNNFSNNLLIEIPVKLEFNDDIFSMDLSHNFIRIVRNTSFNHNSTSLKYLYMNQNQIELIENGSFYFLNNLKELNLASNRISKLDSEIFSMLYSLEKLNLSLNFIELIQKDLFTNIQKLKTLDLGLNRIKFIQDGAFHGLNNLEYLNIFSNQSEFSLSNRTLKGVPSIKQLTFSNNLFYSGNNSKTILYSLQARKYPGKKSSQKYYYSIYLTSNGISYDDQSCSNITFYLRFNLNLNLKSESQLLDFFKYCQNYFNKKFLTMFETLFF
jgi:Leucine-rich repeat (LRR) protein